MFIGQFLKGNSKDPIKIYNGGNDAHAQDPNAYNFLKVLIDYHFFLHL